MKEFKGRASAVGKLMTSSRSKSNPLSKTTESYLQTWMKEQIYGYKHEIGSKYLEKGLEVEEESIDFIAEELGYGFLAKNDMSYENEFITGTPDLIVDSTVIDMKNVWNHWTMPLFEDSVPEKDYYWQLQSYMALCNLDKAKLIYTLMETPTDLLNQWTDVPYEYEGLDSKYRIKVFEIERNDDDIQKIYDRVKECRTYLEELKNSLNEQSIARV